jgi:putative ABC transport system ATP-binding protein
MSTDAETLQGRHLTRTYGDGDDVVVALSDVSVRLSPGEIVLLMGPSGSGKSTLLAILSGLLLPTQGQVLAMGQDLWAMSEDQRRAFRLRNFGFIFQNYNLFPALTAEQQLEIVLHWGFDTSAREARRRAKAMLSLVGLGHRASRLPAHLSSGEKQRVAVARALVKTPAFCFADEPTSALDWEHGKQVVEMLRDAAHNRNSAVLVVTHDLRLVPYADRLCYIEDGKMRCGREQLAVAEANLAVKEDNLMEVAP